MENKILIIFAKENEELSLDFEQPDFGSFVRTVISNHLEVTSENIRITSEVQGFDVEEFKDILISVHEEFSSELDAFFENIKSEIKTYYDDDLSMQIINRINDEKSSRM